VKNQARYTWEHSDWPKWHCDLQAVSAMAHAVELRLARLQGRMESLGFNLQQSARLEVAIAESVGTSEIEGETLNAAAVRSSAARRLGMDLGEDSIQDRNVDAVVDMVLDASANYAQPLTKERILGWHAGLFPTGFSGITKITVGDWRKDERGEMRIVSGELGRERVHYVAPPAARVETEMRRFLNWVNEVGDLNPILKAGRAHLWFEVIHPLDDGNGRIGRAVCDYLLARALQCGFRFFSLSGQMLKERRDYYSKLESASRGDLNDQIWLEWFLGCLTRAIDSADQLLGHVLAKARFWYKWAGTPMNKRQIKMLNLLIDGFEGKLTNSKWAKITKCSSDSALRDIKALVQLGVLKQEPAGGRSTSYAVDLELFPTKENEPK